MSTISVQCSQSFLNFRNGCGHEPNRFQIYFNLLDVGSQWWSDKNKTTDRIIEMVSIESEFDESECNAPPMNFDWKSIRCELIYVFIFYFASFWLTFIKCFGFSRDMIVRVKQLLQFIAVEISNRTGNSVANPHQMKRMHRKRNRLINPDDFINITIEISNYTHISNLPATIKWRLVS